MQRGPFDGGARPLNIVTMIQVTGKNPMVEAAEMKRHIASGAMVTVRIPLIVVLADNQRDTLGMNRDHLSFGQPLRLANLCPRRGTIGGMDGGETW